MLVERHAAQVVAVIERQVHDHHGARDLAQEVWIKVHQGLGSFQAERRFRPWLFAIAMNHVRDNRRKLARQISPQNLDEISMEIPSRQSNISEFHSERDAIEVALDRVPELYRSAVHMVDVLGLNYDEASAALRCSPGTVKSRVHRGRRAFQEAYLGRKPERTRTQARREL
jgi:RNA polymerase sigma-70 factor (ECF subfamily)